MTFPETIQRHISPEPMTGCWLWDGADNGNGYGTACHNGRARRAHRVVFELANGPIPAGCVVDHICNVRACVNPDHLQAITQSANLKRGRAGRHLKGFKTHCKRGHLRSGVNVIVSATGAIACRLCRSITNAEYNRSKR